METYGTGRPSSTSIGHAILRRIPLQLFLLFDQFEHPVSHLENHFPFGQAQPTFVADVVNAFFAFAVLATGPSYLNILFQQIFNPTCVLTLEQRSLNQFSPKLRKRIQGY